MNGTTIEKQNFKFKQIILPDTPDWLPEEPIYNKPKVWEIYLAYIPAVEKHGHQTYGIRPFIINSNDKCNKTSTEISGYVLTGKTPRLPVHVRLFPKKENGLMKASTIVMEQPRTIPKKFLLSKMGVVQNELDRNRIRRAFLIQDGFFQDCKGVSA